MNISLEGRTALVTGSSGGIGSEIAVKLAACGAAVAVHYGRNLDGAELTAHRIAEAGGRTMVLQADLADPAQLDALARQAGTAFGEPVDILVNNAGRMSGRAHLGDITGEDYASMMDVNFRSCVFLTQAILPGMLAKGKGNIVNVASLAAHSGGGPGVALYAAAKGAMLTFTKTIARELAGKGIRVNAVAPGVIAETSNDRFKTDDIRRSIVAGIPLGREGLPGDVADRKSVV